MLPKVLVGAPVSDYHDYCTKEYLRALKLINYPNFDILLIDNSKGDEFYEKIKGEVPVKRGNYFPRIHDRLSVNRNLLRKIVLNEGYDYFLNIDQDVIPQPDIIQRILKHNKKVISGIYFNPWTKGNETKLFPTIWKQHPEDPKKLVAIDNKIIQGNNLIKIDSCGTGCILIHKDVLEKVEFRYDLSFGRGVDDVFFCIDAKENGFEIYADTSLKCKHMILNRPWNWDNLLSENHQ